MPDDFKKRKMNVHVCTVWSQPKNRMYSLVNLFQDTTITYTLYAVTNRLLIGDLSYTEKG